MAKLGYEVVMKMREDLMGCMKFNECYAVEFSNGNVSKKRALKAWNTANRCSQSEDIWERYMRDNTRSAFLHFMKVLDDYYQEGFGTANLEEALGLSRDTIKELATRGLG